MKLIREKFNRVLALVLVSSLVACGSGEQQVVDEPAPVQSAEPAAQMSSASEEPAARPDRFANMFISEVTHDFNPGLPIGAQFPAIRAMFQGEEIMAIDPFIRDRGAIFIAARSADW